MCFYGDAAAHLDDHGGVRACKNTALCHIKFLISFARFSPILGFAIE
jgi:hypothetical protein